IDDTPGISILDLRSKTRRLKHEIGDLDLIVLDYLQLMQGRSNRNTEMNRQQEISEISRSLKALARELNVPILALSQLSRNVEMRAEKKPQLSDLRESGSLEQDADIVMFLYRDEYYNRDDAENENIAELIIAKNRNGPTTSVRLRFDKEILLFQNLERER
ncbi:MAG: DnaB-like helicase C-terminal domain-containing protein, partial [Selenomonadaceae bacterium]|nr:DnaB-like helicase C-terminal domain-containing protein [Selenomonadaceae bacterium]